MRQAIADHPDPNVRNARGEVVGYVARVTESDPLVAVLAGLVVDIVWLDSCGDEEVDPDSAVKMMESVAWVLGNAPDEQRHRFLEVLHDLAESEEHPGRRVQLLAFPFACGLIDHEPPRPAEPWTAWVHPALRSRSES
jgi:hypothetical protein